MVVGTRGTTSEINSNVKGDRGLLVCCNRTVWMEADLIGISNYRGSTKLGISSAIRQVNGGLTEGVEVSWWLGGSGGRGA